MTFSWKGFFLLLLIGAVGWFLYGNYIQPSLNPAATVQIEGVENQEFTITTGSIVSREDVVLSVEEEGTVRNVFVDAGQEVAKGQVIVQLEDDALRANVSTQRFVLAREVAKLDTDKRFTQQRLTNAFRTSSSNLQKNIATVENIFREQVDDLFTNPYSNKPLITVNVPKSKENAIRDGRIAIENIFRSWRSFGVPNTPQESARQIETFITDIRNINEVVLIIYDELYILDVREGSNVSAAFGVAADVRAKLLDIIIEAVDDLNDLEVAIIDAEQRLSDTGINARKDSQEAQVEAEREKLRALEIQLSNTIIRAPFNGIVGEVFIDAGELVKKGDAAFRIISKGGFEVSAEVTEVDIQQISVGQELAATIEVFDAPITVEVRTINTTEGRLDNVPVYTVVFDVGETEQTLRSGLTVDVQIPSDAGRVLVVPREAIQTDRGGAYVVVKRNGKEEEVRIQQGVIVESGKVIIAGEIEEGEEVYTFSK